MSRDNVPIQMLNPVSPFLRIRHFRGSGNRDQRPNFFFYSLKPTGRLSFPNRASYFVISASISIFVHFFWWLKSIASEFSKPEKPCAHFPPLGCILAFSGYLYVLSFSSGPIVYLWTTLSISKGWLKQLSPTWMIPGPTR